MVQNRKKYLALCGGVGGAKLALGLSRVVEPESLTIVVNTGDDFEHLGLLICPDIDTVTYTLGGIVETRQGWGRAGESWNVLDQVEKLGGETWFRLGDKDIALHLLRRSLLEKGLALSEVTAQISRRMAIDSAIIPMSDDPVRTEVLVDEGVMPFQHYFVKQRCQPRISGIRYAGAEQAAAATGFVDTLNDAALAGVIICPSNPFLSIDPILALPGISELLRNMTVPVIAVSPIVGGEAIKGPTAKIMQELDMPVTQQAIVDHYNGLISGLIIDRVDKETVSTLKKSVAVHVSETVMKTTEQKISLANQCLTFIDKLEKCS
ncbi:MAG: 2-phospho-L-lactate transferase [Candidatus Thiodiazotropha sp. (ex Codakia rugifera)]|nr:2-phospho-L-lactate transferase [Candidatus Thiodiazotropha sp. (ex Codakia rugifera)]